jgi:ribosomal protein S18 acetylase RimI-like enzyme
VRSAGFLFALLQGNAVEPKKNISEIMGVSFMEIVKGQTEDVLAVMEIIRRSILRMEEEGIYQWYSGYPTLQIMERDAAGGELYLLKDGPGHLACVTLNEYQSPEYETLLWSYDGRKVLVIHRLVVDPPLQGQGIAKKLMDFAHRYAAEIGCTSIRLDAYSANPRALRLYEGLGYQKVGQVLFPARELPFYCYEKEIRRVPAGQGDAKE